MQAESLEVLEKASVAPAQARAIVRAIEIEIAGAKDTLATKHDQLMLRADMTALGSELPGEMAQLRSELRGEMAQLRSELLGQMTVLAATLRGEMTALESRLREDMAKLGSELRAELHRSVGGVTRQMYLALLGQMAVMLGFFYFFLTQLR